MPESHIINIIHMNDIHSNFDNFKKISTYISEVREQSIKEDKSLLVIDLGDNMDRMQMETEGTDGKINVDILNHIGTDYITIGNNEGLTFSKENLNNVYKDANFKILVCNLKDKATNEKPDWIDEYHIQDIDGLKIGFIGATAPYETFYGLQGWLIDNPLNKIKKIVDKIKPKVDLIILLSHLGIGMDKRVASEIQEIDVILGGHTHSFFENGIKNGNSPLICQVGIYGDYVGLLTIEYNKEADSVIHIKEQTISIKDYKDDENITKIINFNRQNAKANLNQSITVLDKALNNYIDSESPLSNLLADGVMRWTDAEIALINNGQFLNGLEAGVVTREQIHQICPSPINVCKVTLTGQQIKLILEQSLLDDFIYLQAKGFGFRGERLGTLAISGLLVEYDNRKSPYEKIINIYIDRESINLEQEYSVGTLDMFTFGGGYYLIKEGKDIQYFLPEFIREIIAVQLQNNTYIEKSYEYRWIKI